MNALLKITGCFCLIIYIGFSLGGIAYYFSGNMSASIFGGVSFILSTITFLIMFAIHGDLND